MLMLMKTELINCILYAKDVSGTPDLDYSNHLLHQKIPVNKFDLPETNRNPKVFERKRIKGKPKQRNNFSSSLGVNLITVDRGLTRVNL